MWSSGLRVLLLNNEEEKSDVELAEEAEAVLLGQLDREQWRAVVVNNAQGKLLEVARSGDWQLVKKFVADISVFCNSDTLTLEEVSAEKFFV